MDIHEEPVGHHDQCFDVMLEQHLQVPLEAVLLVMRVRKNRHVRRLIQRVLNTPQDRHAKGVSNIEEHHSDAVAPPAAKKPRHDVWPVPEFLRYFFDALLRCQHDGNRGGREAAGLRDIPHSDRLILSVLPFHRNYRLRGHHHPSTVVQYATAPSSSRDFIPEAPQRTVARGSRAFSTRQRRYPRSSRSNQLSSLAGSGSATARGKSKIPGRAESGCQGSFPPRECNSART